MTIKNQINTLVTALNTWGKTTDSKAEPATDLLHFFSIITRGLSLKPGAVRLAVMFNGETVRGDIEELGRVDRSILIGISRGRGLTLLGADALTRDTGAGDPLFDLAEQVRDTILGHQFDSQTGEAWPYYKGLKRIEIEGMLIDAYQIEISIGTQLPRHDRN